MHKSQNLFYLTTALHISGVTITHLQEHKITASTASCNQYTVLLSAAIVEKKFQQDAQVTEFILSDNCSTGFGRHYHPSSSWN